jgi:hypothetical protein
MSGELKEFTLPDLRNRLIKPGDRVRMCAPHPRQGEVGTYMGVERIQASGTWASLIRFEEGVDGCYVTKSDQWEKVQP